ncbi:hypothetical protein [Priestia aryabhattai]
MKKITMYKETKYSYRSYLQAKTFLEEQNVEFEILSLAKSTISEEKLMKFLYAFTLCDPTEDLVITEEDWRKLLRNKCFEEVVQIPDNQRLNFVLENYKEKLMFVGPLIFVDYYDKEGNLVKELEGTGTIGFEKDEFGIYVTKAERVQQINKLIKELNENDVEFNKKIVVDDEFIETSNVKIQEMFNMVNQDIKLEEFKQEEIRIWEFEHQGQEHQVSLAI